MLDVGKASVVVLSVVLLLAGVEKVRTPVNLQATIYMLVPGWKWRIPVRVFGTLELVTAVVLALYPSLMISRLAAVGFGTLFAIAGAYAWRKTIEAPCACFGNVYGGRLGLRQVAAWPVWVALSLMASTVSSPIPNWNMLGIAAVLSAGLASVGGWKPTIDSWRQTGALESGIGPKQSILFVQQVQEPN